MKRKKPRKSSIEKSPLEWERHKLLPTGIVGLASGKYEINLFPQPFFSLVQILDFHIPLMVDPNVDPFEWTSTQ